MPQYTSAAYPHLITFSPTDSNGAVIDYTSIAVPYTVFASADYKTNVFSEVFRGAVYGTSSAPPQIDIAPIARELLGTLYEKMEWQTGYHSMPNDGVRGYIVELQVSSPYLLNMGGAVFVADWNTDYRTGLGLYDLHGHITSDPIERELDPRQLLFISSKNDTDTDSNASVSVHFDGGSKTAFKAGDNLIMGGGRMLYALGDIPADEFDGSIEADRRGHLLVYDLPAHGITARNHVVVTIDGVEHVFDVTDRCDRRYCLYYVNKYGGMDWLLVDGAAVDSWDTERTNVRTFGNGLDRRDFHLRTNDQKITRKYTLTTGMLSDEAAAKIDNLIFSPKVWLHDLERSRDFEREYVKDIITAVNIDTNTVQIVRDRRVTETVYTFTVQESQQYLRQ